MSSVGRAIGVTIFLASRLAGAVSNYHTSDTLICADCHTMHFSMQHGYQGGPVGTQATVGGNWLPAGEPNSHLLKLPRDQLCIACHDGSGMLAPNVVASPTGATAGGSFARTQNKLAPNVAASLTGATAGGSFARTQSRLGGSPGGHALGAPLALNMAKRGSAATRELGCGSCHSPHGSSNFRNLRADPSGTGQKHVVVARVVAPAAKAPLSSAARLDAEYSSANIVYESGMSDWCRSCHADIHQHGDSGMSLAHRDGAVLADSASVNIDSWLKAIDGRVRVERAGGDTRPSPNDRVFCLTFHRAHGSGNRASLIFADGETLTSTCQQCHDE